MQKSQGVAFLSVLFLTLVVLMSLGVIVTRTRLGAQFQLQGQHSVAALYAAEAGIAEALACWHEDKTWAPSSNPTRPGSTPSLFRPDSSPLEKSSRKL